MATEALALAEQKETSLTPENVRISVVSMFPDNEWDFTTEINRPDLTPAARNISWKFQVTKELDFLAPAYSSMLLALKQLVYAMLFQTRARKCRTVVSVIARLKCFVRFLVDRERPICRFQDVLESDLEGYIESVRLRAGPRGKLSPSSFSSELRTLNKLFEYKDRLSDHLRFRATKNKTPNQVAGVRTFGRGGRTQAIPDKELKQLLDAALNYVQERAPLILRCLDEYNLFAKSVDFSLLKTLDIKSRYIEQNFFSTQKDYRSSKELNSALINLRTACLIVIAFCTGMRISEILAAKRGCIRQQPDANHGVFYWIDSLLFKTQKRNAGSPRSWMCGHLGSQAVSALEQMGELLGAQNQTPYIFFAFNNFLLITRTAPRQIFKCLGAGSAGVKLREFCAAHQINIWVHPHRLRRSFARNIIRYSSTSILALKDHFKHWSLYMTDWYIGLDQELIEELEAERLLLSIEAMEKICTQPAGGAGGRRWGQELERRITEGTLPRNFRGKAGAEFRKEMLQGLHQSGMIIIPCGSFTFCIFQKDQALCTKGDRPIINRCNPFDCNNSYILPEHVPFHKKKLAILQTLFDGLSEEEKESPAGLLYMRQIQKVRRNLEPFNNK